MLLKNNFKSHMCHVNYIFDIGSCNIIAQTVSREKWGNSRLLYIISYDSFAHVLPLFFLQQYLLNILKSQCNAFKKYRRYILFRHYYSGNTNNAQRESIKRAIAIIQPCISAISLNYFTFRAVHNKKRKKNKRTQKPKANG